MSCRYRSPQGHHDPVPHIVERVTRLRRNRPALAMPAAPMPAALAFAALALAALALTATACRPGGQTAAGRPGPAATTRAAATHAAASATPASGSHDPARYARPVRTYAAAAGIDAQLLMAILYNESYKPHDPALERAWQKLNPDAAFGVANMHRGTFDDTKRGRDFAGRDWTELPDDPDLAIEAAAWYLHDLAGRLPASWPGRYTKDELLALGYNAGPGGMASFAAGGKPGLLAQAYLDRLHANWDAAARALA
jgi:soluble lytic murein transglycosylase-like protein